MTTAISSMQVHLIPAFNDNYLFVVRSQQANSCFVIDPGDADAVLSFLAKEHLFLSAILTTHHHADHIGGIRKLVDSTGCSRVVGPAYDLDRIPGITETVREDESVVVGGYSAKVLFTPGHTRGHICYHFHEEKALFCGDALFSVGCGRMFEGTQEQMWNSLKKLRALPDDTRVFCAHEYTLSNIRFALSVDSDNADLISYKQRCESLRSAGKPTVPTSMGLEKKVNPFLNAEDANRFGALRRAKDIF